MKTLNAGKKTKKTPAGEIPVEWEAVKLGDVCILEYGNALKEENRQNGEISVYGSNGVIGYHASSNAKGPGIIIGRKGSVGKVQFSSKDFWAIDTTYYVVPADKNIDIRFLHRVFQFLKLEKNNSSSAVPGLNRNDVYSKHIPLPPLAEQSKIAEILSSIDETIEKTRQVIDQTQVLKKGLMQELFTRGIPGRHKKFKKTEIGEIPEEWEVVRLEELIRRNIIISHLDGNHGELYPKQEEFIDSGIPYISANSMINEEVCFDNVKYLSVERARAFKKGVALDGDVLLAHNATVGPVAILNTSYPFVILSTSLTYYRCDLERLNNNLLMFYMQSDLYQKQLKNIMSQTTRNQVPITAQRELLFVLLPIEEQLFMSETIDSLSQRLVLEERLYKRLNQYKSALMQVLLTGEVRVK